jgi:hypothetical protein
LFCYDGRKEGRKEERKERRKERKKGCAGRRVMTEGRLPGKEGYDGRKEGKKEGREEVRKTGRKRSYRLPRRWWFPR